MKIAKEDYKHIASLAGMAILVIGWFAIAKKGVEYDIQQADSQVEYCRSGILSDEFVRYNCPEILSNY